jgi:plasmid maintenance system killer protein
MDIWFSSEKLSKQCNDSRLLVREMGADRAKRIRRRLDDLKAAPCLEDMRNLPGRLHELTKNCAGQLSLDLDHPYRLLFIPKHDPVPKKPDGGMNWSEVTAIEIIGIVDTHE